MSVGATTPRRRVVALDRARGVKRRDEELCVVTTCHALVCALPARWVERLVLPREVAKVATTSDVALVLVGERRYGAWNLGALLGVAPLHDAWVLLRVPHRGSELPIALNTGTCLVVQGLPPSTPLPPGAFRARRGAIAGAFGTAGVRGRATPAALGLWLDPAHLFTDEELTASAAALAAGGGQ
jgi:hypothetical protein